jgi:hypothetical protein
MEVNAYISRVPRVPLRRSRAQQLRSSFPSLPSRRRPQPPWRLIGAVAVPLVVVGVAAYVARRYVFKGVVVFAKAVEEVADTVEDAAEDLAGAAEARAERDGSPE